MMRCLPDVHWLECRRCILVLHWSIAASHATVTWQMQSKLPQSETHQHCECGSLFHAIQSLLSERIARYLAGDAIFTACLYLKHILWHHKRSCHPAVLQWSWYFPTFVQPSFAEVNTNCDLSVHGGSGYKTMVNQERLKELVWVTYRRIW